jgi:hypothetical protein
MKDHRKGAGRANLGMALFINVAWLFVGGIMTFWIGASQLPWMIVGILVTVIGITGINLAVSQQRLP